MPHHPLFSSTRERRLWLWTLLVVTAIYSTLGPARTIAAGLRERNLLAIAVLAGLLLLAGFILYSWRNNRPNWREIGVVLAVLFAYFMVGVRIDSWEERTHLIEYGIIAALIHEALIERVRNGRKLPYSTALIAVVAASLLGFIDEGIQYFMPQRIFDFRDVFFNTFASFMIIAARLAIGEKKGPGWRMWFLWLIAEGYGWGTAVEITGLGELTLLSNPARWKDAVVGVALAGVLVSILQWLILRRYLRRAALWILTSVIAGGLFGVGVHIVQSNGTQSAWLYAIVFLGVSTSLFQWLLIRRQMARSYWWIIACIVGWLLAIPAGEEVGWNGVGAVHGAITGLALVLLLRKYRNKEFA